MTAAALAPPRARDLEVAGALGPLAARWYGAGQPGPRLDSLIVFFHGGGFVGGDVGEADQFLRRLVAGNPGHAVLAPNYTLAAARPFPAAADDAHAVLLWAQKHKARLGWSGKRLLVAGIEAGANLAAVCTLMARDRGGPPLAGQILIMPMLDPGLSSATMRSVAGDPQRACVASACAAGYRGYLPNAADRCHPYASPLQSSRLKNLPQALILSTEDDPLRDEAELYGAKLIGCGVKTTVRRMAPAWLQAPGARNACACRAQTLSAISGFLHALERAPTG